MQDGNNEFAVPVLLRDSTNNYRGGVRLEYNRWHVTLEQGGTTYKNDDQASFNGTQLRRPHDAGAGRHARSEYPDADLRDPRQQRVHQGPGDGQSVFLDEPVRPVSAQRCEDGRAILRYRTGNFALLSSLLLYSGEYNLGTSAASAPHTLGNAGVEIRPFRRLRIIESFTTNRYNATGSAHSPNRFSFRRAAACRRWSRR